MTGASIPTWLLPTAISNRYECACCGRFYDKTPDEEFPDYCEPCPTAKIIKFPLTKADMNYAGSRL
jgi:hypothetical protein